MRALYAVDLEEDAVEAGFDAGRDLLERLGATVDLLYVDPLEVSVWLPEETDKLDWIRAGGLERRDAKLAARLDHLLGSWPLERRGKVLVARVPRPASEIVARGEDHDLLVVGTRTRHGLADLWLGSVAEKVVRTSPVPVLVARGHRRAEGDPRVLVAVDVFAGTAGAVIDEACRWASRLEGLVDLGYASATLGRVDPEVVPVALRRRMPEASRGIVRVARGEPAACVADWSAGYHLVVVASHQRTGVGRLWLGSVAERIVRSAWSPVLVLPLVTT